MSVFVIICLGEDQIVDYFVKGPVSILRSAIF